MRAYQNSAYADAHAIAANDHAISANNNTTTNNTASKTGILSQKHAYTHALLENSVSGLEALRNIAEATRSYVMATHENGTTASVGWWALQSYNDSYITKTQTATNNTASKTGILSQKHSYTHSLLENVIYELNAIKTLLSTINVNTERGVVKSIQRGTASTNGNRHSIIITINSVKPEKCMVILNGSLYSGDSVYSYSILPFVKNLADTTLEVGYDKTDSSTLSWQVIEFY